MNWRLVRRGSLPSRHARIPFTNYGRSLHGEITRVRLQRVKDLLRGTKLPLAEVAALTGYDYPEHLGAIFRQVEGITPSALRRAQERDS